MKNPILKAAARCLFAAVLGVSASLYGQPTPVLHLSFDNVSGTTVINDGSGVGMDGTMNGTATIVPGGMFGNCLQVTGVRSTAGYVSIANAVVPLNVSGGSTWTVACGSRVPRRAALGCIKVMAVGPMAIRRSPCSLTTAQRG